MEFNLSEEHQMMRDMVRDFAESEIKPGASERDRKEEFPTDLIGGAAEIGLMGVAIPEEYGGSGMDYLSYAIALEELAKVDASYAIIVSVNNSLVCDPIYKYGTEEQKQKFLIPLATGEKLGAYALSEAQSGSDAANVKTTCTKDGDDYILNGTKMWITNGDSSDIAIIFAMEDKEKGAKGITAFIVEKDTPGFSVDPKEKKLGIRSSDTCSLVFEDCRVPAENMLGKPGQGFMIAMTTLEAGRIGVASQALGIGQASIDAAFAFAKDRKAFGKTILDLQTIQNYIADLQTRQDAARLITWKACWLKDNGLPYGNFSAMAKAYASEVAMEASNKAVQIHGGYGYSQEYPVERFYRDAKITEIYEGTNEIQRLVITRALVKGDIAN
jgi:butyryl-CoA dehydrogenase